jgi:uncharacterized protein (DUF2236 family)
MGANDGYFPRGSSILRRVHEERAVGLLYGQRALCIGALAPLNYVGTSEHTTAKTTPFRRLAHTGNWFETVIFGSIEEADRVLAAVHKMHRRVNGTLLQTVGRYAAGTPYDAFDPELMLWTVAVMMDSAECFQDLLVRPMRADEREALWQDYIRFGELFGMPRESAPRTYPEFRDYYETILGGGDLWLTDEARHMGRATAFEIPMRAHMQPAKRVHDLIMLGSLPPRVRRIYRLPWTRAHAVAYLAVTRALRLTRRVLPAAVARGTNTRSFDEIANTEAWRIATGRPTPQLISRTTSRKGCQMFTTDAEAPDARRDEHVAGPA